MILGMDWSYHDLINEYMHRKKCNVKADIQQIYYQTYCTSSSDPARSTTGSSAVQRILNRVNLSGPLVLPTT